MIKLASFWVLMLNLLIFRRQTEPSPSPMKHKSVNGFNVQKSRDTITSISNTPESTKKKKKRFRIKKSKRSKKKKPKIVEFNPAQRTSAPAHRRIPERRSAKRVEVEKLEPLDFSPPPSQVVQDSPYKPHPEGDIPSEDKADDLDEILLDLSMDNELYVKDENGSLQRKDKSPRVAKSPRDISTVNSARERLMQRNMGIRENTNNEPAENRDPDTELDSLFVILS